MKANDLINNFNKRSSTVFRDKSIFGMDYIPDILKYRDMQLNLMSAYCSSLNDDVAPKNLLLTGGNATGKTSTIAFLFEVMGRLFSNVELVYINCQMANTAHTVYGELYRKLCNPHGPINGNNNTNLFKKVIEHLKESEKILIICFDDFNRFESIKDLNAMLYKFLRIHETEPGVQISIFTVSYENDFSFDSAVNSIFNRVPIVFNDYTQDEMYEILKDRCIGGFFPEVISDELIKEVALRSYLRRDLRYGIELLSTAGIKADYAGSKTITEDFLD